MRITTIVIHENYKVFFARSRNTRGLIREGGSASGQRTVKILRAIGYRKNANNVANPDVKAIFKCQLIL